MRTLIVEDNHLSSKLLQAVLDSEGYETSIAYDGQEALKILEHTRIDCIVSDVRMPNVDGYRLLYKVKENEKYKNIPFIMYTATFTSEEDEKFAILLGANKYIHKPNGIKEIISSIRELLIDQSNAINNKKLTHEEIWVMKKYSELLVKKLENKIQELEETKESLQKSEVRLKEAQQISHIGSWEIDLINGNQIWSDEMFAIFGIKKEEVPPSTALFLSFIHPEDMDFANKRVELAFITLEDASFNYRFIGKDGVIRHGYSEWKFEFDKNKIAIRLLGIVHDVTEKKKTEEAKERAIQKLALSQKNYRHIIETSQEGIWVIDKDSNTTFINSRMAEMLEYTVEELMNKSILNLFEGEWKTLLHEKLEMRKQGKKECYELKFCKKNGEPLWLYLSSNPILGSDHAYLGSLAMVIDVTDQKKVYKELENKNKQLVTLFETIDEVFYSVDIVGQKLIQISSACEKTYGYPTESFYDNINLWSSVIHPDYRDSYLIDLYKDLTKGKTHIGQYQIIRADKEIRWLENKVNPTLDSEGRLLRTDGVTTDITERKLAEQQLIRTNNELNTFIYKATHDLRGPLSSIIGLTNLANGEKKNAEKQVYLNMISESTQKLDAILLSLIESMSIKDLKPVFQNIDLKKIITDILERLKSIDYFNKIQFKINVLNNNTFNSDQTIINSILQNLIENAIKYSNRSISNSFINVTIEDADNKIKIEITDNGVGMKDEITSKVFTMFYRGHYESKGSGLGLYIVEKGVEKLGGRVELESTEGIGSTFRIILPNIKPE